MNDQADVLQATGISKRFGAHWALRDVDLRVRPGEVHGLLGQNGSGKSTLIKVLAGFHTPEAGSLEMSGRRLSLPVTGKEHREYRMRFVHQDLALVPSMSVADNFTLDQLVAAPALTRARSAGDAASVEETLRQWGLDVSPHALVEHLTRLERAKVAIVKAVSDFTPATAGGLLVLDEPTAFLPPDEAESLFATMRRVADSGAGVLFVSHNLDEIMHHTDRVTVLRDGLQVGSVPIADTSVEAVVELILGRSADEVAPAAVAPIDDAAVPVVRVTGLRAPELAPMELAVQPGEIVGLTGLIGSGFERVPLLLFGAEAATAGSLAIGTDPAIELSEQTPARAVAAGIGYVPSDRLGEATAPSLTVGENATLLRLNRLRNRLGGVPRKPIAAEAHRLIAPVDVRPDDPTLPLTALSGGNQQKVVLAKWLSISPRLLLISEPTQGVDIGARHQIAAILRELAASGCAVICASSDLDQLTELCDRILVFRDGEVTAEVRGAELSKHALMLALFATPTRLDAGGLDEKELKR